ncbi:MAG: hypothetical protein ACE5K3_05855 [bacterium]
MRCLTKVNVGLEVALAFTIFILLVGPVGSYQVGDLLVTSFNKTRLPDYLRRGNWQTIKADENELILKIMTFENVVRRYEFITHEVIAVSYQPKAEAIVDKPNTGYPLATRDTLTNILGLMLQKFLQEGFEIGEGSSFIKIAGVDAYRFELIRPRISTEQWLKGYPPIKYAWHILLWKKGWYLITYSNFDNAFPGPHFSEFETFLRDLKFVDQNLKPAVSGKSEE